MNFYIRITRDDGRDAFLKPGSQGERDLIGAVMEATKRRGVGVFKTEASVMAAIREAMTEVLLSLKSEVVPPRMKE